MFMKITRSVLPSKRIICGWIVVSRFVALLNTIHINDFSESSVLRSWVDLMISERSCSRDVSRKQVLTFEFERVMFTCIPFFFHFFAKVAKNCHFEKNLHYRMYVTARIDLDVQV